MLTINWTDAALDDLDAIFDMIAKDAPSFAQSFIQEIMQSVDRLNPFPKSGRKIPEADSDSLRAVIFQGYRIITETHEKGTLYSRLSVAWMLQSSLHGGIYGVS